MDCCAFCNATSYKIKAMYEELKTRYKATMIREVLHIEIPMNETSVDFFFFPYGAAVSWGISKDFGFKLLNEIKPFLNGPLEEIETDEFTYQYVEKAQKIVEDEITLPDHDVLTKLSFSHAIAQSVKLGTFEASLHNTFEENRKLPEEMSKKGKISLSRKEITMKMGSLFLERNSINIHLDVLDTPDFFWEHPELDTQYQLMANYLDVKTRVEVLNHRLNVLHELLQMLGTELNHQHSSRLEWTIILLIVIEVVVVLLKDVLKVI